MRVQSYRSAGNISYPYGDSNRRRFFSSTLRHETFYPPMGTATAIVCTSVHLCTETFRTPMGTATFSVIHRRTLRRNISYPYGDSNINGRAIVYPLVRNISYPYGDSNQVSAFYSKHPFSVTFHTPMGTKRKPICPIGHIGFYFIRYCYSHVTPPIPSAVLMPTPAYGAKCSSRFAIVR